VLEHRALSVLHDDVADGKRASGCSQCA
jgi:hypothetical protein